MSQFVGACLLWLPLLALSSCGSSDPSESDSDSDSKGGTSNSGTSGAGATSGLSGSSGPSAGTGGAASGGTSNPGGRGGDAAQRLVPEMEGKVEAARAPGKRDGAEELTPTVPTSLPRLFWTIWTKRRRP